MLWARGNLLISPAASRAGHPYPLFRRGSSFWRGIEICIVIKQEFSFEPFSHPAQTAVENVNGRYDEVLNPIALPINCCDLRNGLRKGSMNWTTQKGLP